jgi:hypothetical protein
MRQAGAFVLAMLAVACEQPRSSAAPSTAPTDGAASVPEASAVAILRHLDDRIARGVDSEEDRERAYQRVRAMADDGSADYAYARAALAGRVAESRGAGAGKLVTQAEVWARAALQRDPDYDDGAATRMLGTLYVMAPGRLVDHGDSEDGLAMLEARVDAHPVDPRNHLRVAEAYLQLGDPERSRPHLCLALRDQADLRADERRRRSRIVDDAGGRAALACGDDPS